MDYDIKKLHEIGRMLDWNFECAKQCYDYESRVDDEDTKLILHQMAQKHIKHYLTLTKKLQSKL